LRDISLPQLLALIPHEFVKAHLGFSDDKIATLCREKQEVI